MESQCNKILSSQSPLKIGPDGILKENSSKIAKILDFVFLMRIPLLAPVWTIFLLGWISGTEKAKPFGGLFFGSPKIELPTWIAMFGFSLLVASIYIVNQIADIESDKINHKLFLLPHKLVSIKSAWFLATTCTIIGFLTAHYFGQTMLILFSISFILGIFYNLPPLSLKDNAWGGIFANALGHGLLTFYIGYVMAQFQSGGDVNYLDGFLASLAPAFANAAVFLTTTIPDAQGDAKTGKQTFCVLYGEKATSFAALIFCILALIASFLIKHNAWIMITTSTISAGFFVYLAITSKREFAFKTFKWPVFLLSALVALYIPLYAILMFLTFFLSRAYYKWRFDIEYPTFKSK